MGGPLRFEVRTGVRVSSDTRLGDDLGVSISRIVVADLVSEPDAALDVALRRARERSADGDEVVYLGSSDPVATAWAVRAEDASAVHVVAVEATVQELRAALVGLGLDDVEVRVVPPG